MRPPTTPGVASRPQREHVCTSLEGDVACRSREIEQQQPDDGGVTTGPGDADALEGPEGPERREEDTNHQLQEAPRYLHHETPQQRPNAADHDDGGDAADDCDTELPCAGAERDDDERHLEP